MLTVVQWGKSGWWAPQKLQADIPSHRPGEWSCAGRGAAGGQHKPFVRACLEGQVLQTAGSVFDREAAEAEIRLNASHVCLQFPDWLWWELSAGPAEAMFVIVSALADLDGALEAMDKQQSCIIFNSLVKFFLS